MEYINFDKLSNTKLQGAIIMVISFVFYLYLTLNKTGPDALSILKTEAKLKLRSLGPFTSLN